MRQRYRGEKDVGNEQLVVEKNHHFFSSHILQSAVQSQMQSRHISFVFVYVPELRTRSSTIIVVAEREGATTNKQLRLLIGI